MFTVGEIATNSPHANAGNCNSTMPSIGEFAAVVCKTSAVSHNLFLKCNEKHFYSGNVSIDSHA